MNGGKISLTYATLKPIDSKPKSRKPEPEKKENIQGIGHGELGIDCLLIITTIGRLGNASRETKSALVFAMPDK